MRKRNDTDAFLSSCLPNKILPVANRDNHYEAAFEAFLASRRIPYVAVDEARRAKWGDGSLKSLDFIVAVGEGASWLVDVKGRRFPSGEQKQYWKNWSTRDDLQSMAEWQRLFGASFGGLFVFAYVIVGQRSPLAAEQIFDYRDADTASSASGGTTTRVTPIRFPPAGTRWRCRRACFANSRCRSTIF